MNFNVKQYISLLFFVFICFSGFSQSEESKWKAQIALGINHPFADDFVEPFEGKSVNFPTVNLGVQHMFNRQIGAKLDYGFSRISHTGESPEFKLNYSRINAQFVYDGTRSLMFLPARIGLVAHTGPGFTFVKPLGDYPDNKTSFFNVMAGVELHYNIARTVSVFFDTSYIIAMSKDFDPLTDGYGSYNGNLLTFTIGASISLSGCQYCD